MNIYPYSSGGASFARQNETLPLSGNPCLSIFLPAAVEGSGRRFTAGISSLSLYNSPLLDCPERLGGYNRNWGGADSGTQARVMELILEKSAGLELADRAALLAIARLESGFNPDAASIYSSAAGVFQIISRTWRGLGMAGEDPFSAAQNIEAGIKLFRENIAVLAARYPGISGDDRVAALYALHHDGSSINGPGWALAWERVLPFMKQFLEIATLYEGCQAENSVGFQ